MKYLIYYLFNKLIYFYNLKVKQLNNFKFPFRLDVEDERKRNEQFAARELSDVELLSIGDAVLGRDDGATGSTTNPESERAISSDSRGGLPSSGDVTTVEQSCASQKGGENSTSGSTATAETVPAYNRQIGIDEEHEVTDGETQKTINIQTASATPTKAIKKLQATLIMRDNEEPKLITKSIGSNSRKRNGRASTSTSSISPIGVTSKRPKRECSTSTGYKSY
ncbi:MAG: hypothetical protein FD188_3145 [Ignavibacteria bacterium]|nr:MAG: hypothetical protein FD188_3145 [Ignavibacteria bacterium]